MLELLFWAVIAVLILSIGSVLIDPNRVPARAFYTIALPVVLFLLWQVGALGWLFGV